MSDDAAILLRELRRRSGVTISRGGKHVLVRTAKGQVPVPNDVSGPRAIKNIRAQLRRIGAL